MENKNTIQTATQTIETAQNAQTVAEAATASIVGIVPTLEVISVGEYLARLDAGEVVNPAYQSGLRWPVKMCDAFAADLAAGKAVPPIIVAVIPCKDGKALVIRVDGNQRTFSVLRARDALAEKLASDCSTEEQEKAEKMLAALEAAQLPILSYRMSAAQSADFFRRLNAGVKLSGVQAAKAEYSAATQEALNGLRERMEAQRGAATKWGKANPDTASSMLLAAVLNPAKASSASATARLVLKECQQPGIDALTACQTALKVIARLEASDKAVAAAIAKEEAAAAAAEAAGEVYIPGEGASFGPDGPDGAYWASPARLIPLALLCQQAQKGVSAEDMPALVTRLANVCRSINRHAKGKISITRPSRGKAPAKKEAVTVCDIWSDTSNAHKATSARFQHLRSFYADMAKAEQAKAAQPAQNASAQPASAQAAAAAFTAAVNEGGEA